jgi:magnesium transporter
MIVDCAVYRDGKRLPRSFSIEEAANEMRATGGFVWIGLHEPSAAEFDQVRAQFDLHELAVEDAIIARQRPKLEVYEDTVFVVLKTTRYLEAEEEIEFGDILLFLGEMFVVVVRHGEATGLAPVRRSLDRRPDVLRLGPSAVLHAIMDKVVDDYVPVLIGLGKDIDEVEADVFSAEWSNPAERIYFLKREVLEFQAAARPLVDPSSRLMRGTVPAVAPELYDYFRDIHDHVVRVASQLDQYRDLLTSILEANLTQVSVRQNEDMRKISAWVAIAVVPTLIAGIFGMNFNRMPGVQEIWGFPAAIAVMAAAALGLHTLFRRSGWL